MADADLRSRAALAVFDALDSAAEYGAIVVDADGTMRLFTRGAERLIGRGLTYSGPESWPETFGTFRADMVTPFPVDEFPLVRAIRGVATDGVVMFIRNPRVPQGVWVSITGRPIFDAEGAVTGGISLFHDISDAQLVVGRPELRVLFMSGYADGAIVQQGELEPGMAFLNKPCTPARTAREVRAVLEAPAPA